MAREAKGEALAQRSTARALVRRNIGPEASGPRRAATLSAVALTGGAAGTGIGLAANAVGPHIAGAVGLAEPGLIGLGVAAGASAFFNLMHYDIEVRTSQRLAERYSSGGTSMNAPAQRLLDEAQRERAKAVSVNSWIGRIAVACGGAMGTMTAGFDVTHLAHGQTLTGMAGTAEVLTAGGVVALASARQWRRAQARHDGVQ